MSKDAPCRITSEAYAGKSVRFAGTEVAFSATGVAHVDAATAKVIAAYPGAFTVEIAKPAKKKSDGE